MNYYEDALKKYAVFTGRATRAEYWIFMLYNMLIVAVLTGIDILIGWDAAILATTYGLAVLIPHIAVATRRLHDINYSGWWLLISFIPVIGMVTLLIFMMRDSYPEKNQYGNSPKPPTNNNRVENVTSKTKYSSIKISPILAMYGIMVLFILFSILLFLLLVK